MRWGPASQLHGSPPVDEQLVVEHVGRAGLAVEVEVCVLSQVDWGGLVGSGLDVELQLVGVCQHIRRSHLQRAWEALQHGSLQIEMCVEVQIIHTLSKESLFSGALGATLELANS